MDKPAPPISIAAAKWIRTLMAERGITMSDLAKSTHIARVTLIRRFDSNPGNFTVGELDAIAQTLNIKVSDITGAAENAA
jgi:DNA-binding Xre family transcriptional regulator